MSLPRFGERTFTLMTANLEHDGGPDEDGAPPPRWIEAHEAVFAPFKPDVLFRQEATYSHFHGRRRLHTAERVLGMRGFLSAPRSSRNATALFIRPDVLDVLEHHEHRDPWRAPPTNIVARLQGVQNPLTLMSWHCGFPTPSGRVREAEEILAVADKTKKGWGFVGAGDCNEYPVPVGETVPPIDWASPDVTDRVHMMQRSIEGPDGSRVSCTSVDRLLLGAGLHDPARYAAHHLDQPRALAATAGHAPSAKGQGGPRRIDRLYLDPWLVQAVLEVFTVDMSGVSDHHAVVAVLSYSKAVEALARSFEPLAPVELTPTGGAR
ncbi:endonuclease/exonuclease/phosphatase family protein [Streptomyces tsukubensis]|nr:endonuclease/exonuclease/phosphatase family protein [Streptomyces tsukubensis]